MGPVAALLAGLAVASAGCTVGESTRTRPPIQPGSVAEPHRQLAPGGWTATGTVVQAVNNADQPTGHVLVRPWTFIKQCASSCRTLFLRQTLYGPSLTTVSAHAGFYVAAFPPVTVPCAHYEGEDAGTEQSYDTYRLWWSADRGQLYAVSGARSVGRRCPGSQTIRWVATRTNPTKEPAALGP
jgi:hypothetical protein